MTRRDTRSVLAVTIALAAAIALVGCAPARPATSSSASSGQPGAKPQLHAADLPLMSPEEKQSQIAPSFPIQVPVPQGTVTRGEAQGNSAWDYQLTVKGDPYAVAAWYHIAYSRAEWQITGGSDTNGVVVMDLQKGDAQSRVRVESAGNGTSKVTATVGVGTPVLQTQ